MLEDEGTQRAATKWAAKKSIKDSVATARVMHSLSQNASLHNSYFLDLDKPSSNEEISHQVEAEMQYLDSLLDDVENSDLAAEIAADALRRKKGEKDPKSEKPKE